MWSPSSTGSEQRPQDLEEIEIDGQVAAIILRSGFSQEGIRFFTPNDYSQQLAHMKHPSGTRIDPHRHNHQKREILLTNEVLIIKSGSLRVDLYDGTNRLACSRVLSGGDLVLLVTGAHGFEVLEEVEMIEVKQGPYLGEADKTRFTPLHRDTE